MNYTRCARHSTHDNWKLLCQKMVSREEIRNYISHILWGVITYRFRSNYLSFPFSLAQKFFIVRSVHTLWHFAVRLSHGLIDGPILLPVFAIWTNAEILKVNLASSMWLNCELTKKYWHLVEKAGTTAKFAHSWGIKIQSMWYFLNIHGDLWLCPCFVDYI